MGWINGAWGRDHTNNVRSSEDIYADPSKKQFNRTAENSYLKKDVEVPKHIEVILSNNKWCGELNSSPLEERLKNINAALNTEPVRVSKRKAVKAAKRRSITGFPGLASRHPEIVNYRHLSTKELCAKYNASANTIRRALRELGYPRGKLRAENAKKYGGKRCIFKQYPELFNRLDEPVDKLSKEYNIPRHVFYDAFRKLGTIRKKVRRSITKEVVKKALTLKNTCNTLEASVKLKIGRTTVWRIWRGEYEI